VDVRVIAATNRDLPALVEERAFREDLYFRLNVVELTLPPLRERLDDLPTIIGSLLRQSWAASGRPGVRGLEDAALDALLRYDWPGNVRELINVLERAVLVCRGESITVRDLPAQILEPGQGGGGGALFDGGLPPSLLEGSWKDARAAVLRAAERAYLVEALTRCRGVMADTARHAGLSTRSLYDKMRAHGLRRQDFT
jgi:DNA-binding NtrC family response regulator